MDAAAHDSEKSQLAAQALLTQCLMGLSGSTSAPLGRSFGWAAPCWGTLSEPCCAATAGTAGLCSWRACRDVRQQVLAAGEGGGMLGLRRVKAPQTLTWSPWAPCTCSCLPDIAAGSLQKAGCGGGMAG